MRERIEKLGEREREVAVMRKEGGEIRKRYRDIAVPRFFL